MFGVSRWETGSNMPDLALLVEMADFTNEQKRKLLRMIQWLFVVGCVSFILHIIVDSYRPDVSDFIYGLLKGATLGIPVAIVSMGVVWTGKYLKFYRKRNK